MGAREYRAAVARFIEDPTSRLIVLRVDDTGVPPLISDLKWVDLRDEDVVGAIEQIMGFRGPADRVMALQRFLESTGIQVEYIPGYGPIVGCPQCGAGLDQIRAWHQVDERRDDTYAGAECLACRWNDGGEI